METESPPVSPTPQPRPDEPCGWCNVRALAVPDVPPTLWEGRWYHRGCLAAARLEAIRPLPPVEVQ